MTLHQIEAFAIIGGMLVLFASDRLRYDLVSALALTVATLAGVVPANRAFLGFANPVIIIIASVLVLSRAIAVSGLVDIAMRRALRHLRRLSLQLGALIAAVTFLSAFMKNVGALGIFMPIAIQAAQRGERPPSLYLMPLAFGSLIGGTITLIGTSPNLLISTVRQETIGHPYHLFDFAPVGLPLSIVAIAFLAVGWRLLPRDRRAQTGSDRRPPIDDYQSEARLPPASPMVGHTVEELEALGEGDVTVIGIIREHDRRYIPAGHWRLFADDVLVMQADPAALQPFVAEAGLELLGAAEIAATAPQDKDDDLQTVEAVVGAESALIGRTPSQLHLRQSYEVNVLALSRGGQRISAPLRRNRFRMGDIVLLQGRRSRLPETLASLGCLPLAGRSLTIGREVGSVMPLLFLLGAMVLIATGVLHAEVAFFAAAVLVVLTGRLSPVEAYEAVEWPIIVMLACLIPVGEALRDTGAARLIADGLTILAAHLPGGLAVALVLVVSMLVTPFLHHAAAVLVMGPIAASVAHNLHDAPDAFLMAVAVGASCDFLTPIGHQNNALVMGPGGYRFGDYWRLGLPLSCIVAVFGTWLILQAWPLH
ncbi:MAG TPA: SLC13 family permease [Acetobacteraceae bacterium]|nr:SLC13 family permease [Acetobacteraceae bacterium]